MQSKSIHNKIIQNVSDKNAVDLYFFDDYANLLKSRLLIHNCFDSWWIGAKSFFCVVQIAIHINGIALWQSNMI